ncbi:biotin--protein ligase [Pseudomonas sp. TTU2014-105ASC]|nr:biotin--protein ligase [Pseudomonas sp. TTU2014-105ASC]
MNRLLRLLQDGRFHSGRELGLALGVSRSAVWKHLQRIQSETGLPLYRVPGRGYRLAEPLSLFEHAKLEPRLKQYGWSLNLYDTIDSTNAEALRLLPDKDGEPFIVVAEAQTSGRGRRGRTWISPFGQNLYCSFALKVGGGTKQLAGMSLVVGLAVMQTLRRLGVEAGLKWPNDLYVDGRKIAGILLELTGDPADLCHVVIGVGVNVNMVSAEGIDQPWTSIKEQVGMVDRNELLLALTETLKQYLARHFDEGFSALRAEWEASHIWQGRNCTLSTGSSEYSGVVIGVDLQGGLRMTLDGCEHSFSGGELSLRLDP